VQYVLEGSVRKSGNRILITAVSQPGVAMDQKATSCAATRMCVLPREGGHPHGIMTAAALPAEIVSAKRRWFD